MCPNANSDKRKNKTDPSYRFKYTQNANMVTHPYKCGNNKMLAFMKNRHKQLLKSEMQ
jgi:hypothetical protein